MTRHLSCLADLGAQGLGEILDAAERFREQRRKHECPLTGRAVALVFEKASTRTRISLEVAVVELGGHPVVMTSAGSQIGRGEPIRDTARVLSRMVDAIAFRTAEDSRLREMMEFSSVPVLNALTDDSHPMQLLADLMTVRRVKQRLTGLRFAWIGDGNNMAHSWLEAAGLLGLKLTLACPRGYEPGKRWLDEAKRLGAEIALTHDPREAARNADVISTDVFASMGQEAQQAERRAAFASFTLTPELVSTAAPEVMVLHCLPAHRGEEISEEVLEGPRSFVWDQAEARLHTAKAALCWALTPA